MNIHPSISPNIQYLLSRILKILPPSLGKNGRLAFVLNAKLNDLEKTAYNIKCERVGHG
jgi:hypothetical protein